jgi:hypothetical protein
MTNRDKVSQALQSGSLQMTMPQYLEYNRNYVRDLLENHRNMKILGAPEYLIERTRIELASLGVRP